MAFSIRRFRGICLGNAAAFMLVLHIPAYGNEVLSDIPIEASIPSDGTTYPGVGDRKAAPLLKPIPASRNLRIQLPGFSHHFSAPAAAKYGKKWNEENYGLGVELRDPMTGERWADWSVLKSAGLMKDSLGAWGGYAGVALQKRLLDTKYTLDLGPSFWLLWRTLDFGGPHLLIPAVLPSLSVEDQANGWGVNSVLIPGFRWHTEEMPTVLWVGITKSY